MKDEQLAFMTLFCALILVKRNMATLEQSVTIVPLGGKAKELVAKLLHEMSRAESPRQRSA
jgi:hypothetical protein